MTITERKGDPVNAYLRDIQAEGWECRRAGPHGRGSFYHFAKGAQIRIVVTTPTRVATDYQATGH